MGQTIGIAESIQAVQQPQQPSVQEVKTYEAALQEVCGHLPTEGLLVYLDKEISAITDFEARGSLRFHILCILAQKVLEVEVSYCQGGHAPVEGMFSLAFDVYEGAGMAKETPQTLAIAFYASLRRAKKLQEDFYPPEGLNLQEDEMLSQLTGVMQQASTFLQQYRNLD